MDFFYEHISQLLLTMSVNFFCIKTSYSLADKFKCVLFKCCLVVGLYMGGCDSICVCKSMHGISSALGS